MDILDKLPEESTEVVESLVQLIGLLLTSYPVVSPLLEQLKENTREALALATDALPRITKALNEIELDSEATDKFANQLFEAVPELRKFFQRAEG